MKLISRIPNRIATRAGISLACAVEGHLGVQAVAVYNLKRSLS